jgi:hypothetical protein
MTVSIGQICDDVSSIEVVAYLDDPPVEMRIDTETGATTAVRARGVRSSGSCALSSGWDANARRLRHGRRTTSKSRYFPSLTRSALALIPSASFDELFPTVGACRHG